MAGMPDSTTLSQGGFPTAAGLAKLGRAVPRVAKERIVDPVVSTVTAIDSIMRGQTPMYAANYETGEVTFNPQIAEPITNISLGLTGALGLGAAKQPLRAGMPKILDNTPIKNPIAKSAKVAEPFQNVIHEKPFVIGKPSEGAHLAESGYAYRSLGQDELDAIAATGQVLPPTGKVRGGRQNVKHWSRADGSLYYRPDQQVIRVKNENIFPDKVVESKYVEVWNPQTNSFSLIAKE